MTYRDPERPMCLRCSEVALSPVEIAGVGRHTCTRCDGTWIADDQLRSMMVTLGLEPDEPLGPLGPSSMLACPVCRREMVVELAYGGAPEVHVDVCPDHGVWFDAGELAAIVGRLHLERSDRDREQKALTGGQLALDQLTGGITSIARAIRNAWRGPRPRPRRSRGRAYLNE